MARKVYIIKGLSGIRVCKEELEFVVLSSVDATIEHR